MSDTLVAACCGKNDFDDKRTGQGFYSSSLSDDGSLRLGAKSDLLSRL